MPKRNRTKEQRASHGPVAQNPPAAAIVPSADSEQARAAKLFVASVKAHEAADRAERDRRAAEAASARRHDELVAAKESAAAVIRRLRSEGRPRQKMADAEAAYRIALAELHEFETGERPHWAPPAQVEPDPESDETDAEVAAEGSDE